MEEEEEEEVDNVVKRKLFVCQGDAWLIFYKHKQRECEREKERVN